MPRPIKNQTEDPPTIRDYMDALTQLTGEELYGIKTRIIPGRVNEETGEKTGIAYHLHRRKPDKHPVRGLAFGSVPDMVDHYGATNIVVGDAVTNPLIRLEEAAHNIQQRKGSGLIANDPEYYNFLSDQLIRQYKKTSRQEAKEIEDRQERREAKKGRRENKRYLRGYVGSNARGGARETEAKVAALKASLLVDGIVQGQVTEDDLPSIIQYVQETSPRGAMNLFLDAAKTEKGREILLEYLNIF